MKKSLVVLLILTVFSINVFSQNDVKTNDTPQNFNEIKLNALFLVIGAFDVTYERTINEESAVGLNVFIPIDEDISDDINYYISPYYRLYFGKKHAAGFFMEGFGMLNSINNYSYTNNIDPTLEKETITDFALGFGLGGKWVTNNGFIGELNLGIGRNLVNNDSDEIVGKIGISLGYRF